MQELRYYYSKAGSVNGPVTTSALAKLIREKVVDPSCYLCREGEEHWEPLKPELFQARPNLPVPAPKKVAVPKRKRNSWYSATRLMDPHIRRNLNVIIWMSIFVGGLIEMHLRYVVFAATHAEPGSPLEVVGYFLGASSAIGVMGYLFSLMFPDSHRRLGRAIGMFSFAVIFCVLSYVLFEMGFGTIEIPAVGNPQILRSN